MKLFSRAIASAIITFLLITLLVINTNAASYEYTEQTQTNLDYYECIPDELWESTTIKRDDVIDNDINISIITLIQDAFIDNNRHLSHLLSISIATLVILSLLSHINPTITVTQSKIAQLLSTIAPFITFPDIILSTTKDIIHNTNQLLSLTNNTISSVFLIIGANHSTIASNVSLSLLLTTFEQLITQYLVPFSTILLALLIVENLHSPLKSLGITKSIKKNLVSVLIFSFSFLLAIIALNGSLAASQDNLSLRGIKFATVNVVPILGSSVSEAMKTLVAGVNGLRNTIGILSAYAILSTTLPGFVTLYLYKLIFRFNSICASLLCIPTASSVYDGIADIIDILLAIIAAVTVTSFFSIFIFTNLISF